MTGADAKKQRIRLHKNQSEYWNLVHVGQAGGSRYECGRRIPKTVQVLLTLAYGGEKQAHKVFNKLRGQRGIFFDIVIEPKAADEHPVP